MKVIATEKAPGAIGPYSQGFIAGGFVYTSGQIPVNPADGTVPEGIAAQTIVLAATQAGYGGCMLHAFNKAGVTQALGLEAAGVAPLMVIALGRPAEDVRLEPLSSSPDGSTNYWRDEASVHHVPKRWLAAVLV